MRRLGEEVVLNLCLHEGDHSSCCLFNFHHSNSMHGLLCSSGGLLSST